MERGATENFECSSVVELKEDSKVYFAVPSSIILNKGIGDKRVATFSFFSTYRGIMNKMFFSVNAIALWFGKQPNRCSSGINAKIIENINYLKDEGYLKLFHESDEIKNSTCIEGVFNLSKVLQECDQGRFATIYIDELDKVMKYRNPSPKDNYLQNDTLLLIFAYLRMKIPKRRNKMLPDEINLNGENNIAYDIKQRKMRYPEAYDCYYQEISEDLNVGVRTVSKAISVLNELGLIYSEILPRIKFYDDNNGSVRWITDHSIFCNTYKRETTYLLASGKEYYQSEVENKKKKLKILNV